MDINILITYYISMKTCEICGCLDRYEYNPCRDCFMTHKRCIKCNQFMLRTESLESHICKSCIPYVAIIGAYGNCKNCKTIGEIGMKNRLCDKCANRLYAPTKSKKNKWTDGKGIVVNIPKNIEWIK